MGYLSRYAQSSTATPKKEKKGGFHLPKIGLAEFGRELVGMGGGLAQLGTSWLPGGTAAGAPWAGLAKGTATSVAKRGVGALDIATAGKAHGATDKLRRSWEQRFDMPEGAFPSLSEEYRERGLLPMAVEYIGTASIAGSAGKAMAARGAVGAKAALQVAEAEARSAGATAGSITRLAKATKRAAKVADEVDPGAVAARAKTIERLDKIAHPYENI